MAGLIETLIYPFRRLKPPEAKTPMGFFTDTTLCIGCKACEVACKQEHNPLPHEAFDPKRPDASKYVSVWGDGPQIVDGKLDFTGRVTV